MVSWFCTTPAHETFRASSLSTTSLSTRLVVSNMLALLTASSGLLAGQPRMSQPRVVTRHASVLAASDNFYDFSARAIVTGADVPLSDFKGKVSLVVNVASA